MSYSLSVTAPRTEVANQVDAEIVRYVEEQVVPGGHQPVDEVQAHLDAVAETVARLATAVGRDEDTIAVSISGHANPGHAPTEGYAEECVTISLSVVQQPS